MLKEIIETHLASDVNHKNILCETYKHYGSDKSTYHNYSGLYFKLFDEFKNVNINFLELGLGTNHTDVQSSMGPNGKPGASLYAVSDVYTNWDITGLDIDRRILFQDPDKRIKTYFVDQTNDKIIQDLYSQPELMHKQFHVIIDDGLHEFPANVTFFNNSFDKLASGGYYIIEDILNDQLSAFDDYFVNTGIDYHLFHIPHPANIWDNNLLIIKKA
jgi:hypothetical protein